MKTVFIIGRPKSIFAALLLATFFLVSCKKGGLQQPVQSPNEIINSVNAWLEKQKASATTAGAATIQSLKENLDFSGLTTVLFGTDETVVIIPMHDSFVASSNAGKDLINSLVLFVNTNNEIRKGNIVQYVSPKAISGRRALSDFFTRYYGFKITDFTGSLVYVTVTDEIAYELNYINGNVNFYKSMGKKQLGPLTETCYEVGFYYFWSDGSVTWEPVGGYCDGCEPVRTSNGETYRLNCGGGGGTARAGSSFQNLLSLLCLVFFPSDLV